jgi:hypothetical protein
VAYLPDEMGRYQLGNVAGCILRSKDNASGFIVQVRNPPFKAWGNLENIKQMVEGKWKSVTITESTNYGNPVGVVYLSRDRKYFNVKSKQRQLNMIGRTKNLNRFLDGMAHRVFVHQRIPATPPQLPPLALKIKRKGRHIYYWIGVDGSRYGVTLNHEELTALIRKPIPEKIDYGQQILGDLFIRPKEDGTMEVGWLGSQRRLITTPAQLNQVIDKHFITLRMENKEWGPPILKPLGWEKESTPQETIFTKTHSSPYGEEKAKIYLFVTKNENDMPTWGADMCMQYTKSYKLVGIIKTPPSKWGNQTKRWAKRELRTIGRIILSD